MICITRVKLITFAAGSFKAGPRPSRFNARSLLQNFYNILHFVSVDAKVAAMPKAVAPRLSVHTKDLVA